MAKVPFSQAEIMALYVITSGDGEEVSFKSSKMVKASSSIRAIGSVSEDGEGKSEENAERDINRHGSGCRPTFSAR